MSPSPSATASPAEKTDTLSFTDSVYGEQSKQADEVEDFALLRSDGMPTYHLASCADDADLRITHIVRGQDHLTNTFKHLLIFSALGVPPPQFAHLPLLVAPDGAKLSKRKHGPVVSVTTYRDAGFLPQAFVNFLCLLGWSPKNDREFLTLDELTAAFTLESVNRANAVINFTEEDPFDPKAVWLNAEHIRALPVEELAARLASFFTAAGLIGSAHSSPEGAPSISALSAEKGGSEANLSSDCAPFISAPSAEMSGNELSCRINDEESKKLLAVTPLIRERIKLLRDAVFAADFFFLDHLAPYDPSRADPAKRRRCYGPPRPPARAQNPPQHSLRSQLARPGSSYRRRTTWLKSRPGLSAHPRSRMRTQERPAAL